MVIKAPDEQVLGEPLTLECKIKTAVDIDDTFNVIWTNDITEARRVENIPTKRFKVAPVNVTPPLHKLLSH